MSISIPSNSILQQELIDLVKKVITEAIRPTYSPDDLLDDAQASKILGNAKGTMSVWRHHGKGPAYVKIGSNVRYRYSELQRYIDSQTISP